jgi:ankyrin repeat protein
MTRFTGSRAGITRQGLLAVAVLALHSVYATAAERLPDNPQELQAMVFESARTGDAATITRLLGRHFNLNLRDETGQTPLITAALAGQDDVARLLIDNKADVMARTNNGMTALHAAAYSGDAAIAAMLIAHGADLNDQANVAGITPLHAAAEEDHPDVVMLLVADGADIGRLEVNGYTAGSRAGWREHWQIVSYLLRSGDACQPEDVAGAWLYDKCTHLDLGASN